MITYEKTIFPKLNKYYEYLYATYTFDGVICNQQHLNQNVELPRFKHITRSSNIQIYQNKKANTVVETTNKCILIHLMESPF